MARKTIDTVSLSFTVYHTYELEIDGPDAARIMGITRTQLRSILAGDEDYDPSDLALPRLVAAADETDVQCYIDEIEAEYVED